MRVVRQEKVPLKQCRVYGLIGLGQHNKIKSVSVPAFAPLARHAGSVRGGRAEGRGRGSVSKDYTRVPAMYACAGILELSPTH